MEKKNNNEEVKIFKEGEVFNSFKELFGVLKWLQHNKQVTGNNKKRLVKQLETLCSFHKIQGTNKIMIDKIYENKKIEKNYNSKVNYYDSMEQLLLSNLIKSNDKVYTLTQLAKEVGLINLNYNHAKKYRYNLVELMSCENYEQRVLEEFFMTTQVIIKNNITSVLSHLKKNNIINFKEVLVVIKPDKETFLETIKQDLETNEALTLTERFNELGERINEVMLKNYVLKDKEEIVATTSEEYVAINRIMEEVLEYHAKKYCISRELYNWRELTKVEHFKRQGKVYFDMANVRLLKELGIKKSYMAYEISINQDFIKNPKALVLSSKELLTKTEEVNKGFKKRIATNIKNRNKKAIADQKKSELKKYYLYRTFNEYIEDCNWILQLINDLYGEDYRAKIINKTLKK